MIDADFEKQISGILDSALAEDLGPPAQGATVP